ncbi:hypothetical protein GC101_17280 [Paenibacillus sp. LMG 31459]|uniref:MFS transporter n=1 Tax=Paenibacillus phytohabitans TaxID=2654978 RepID=A0ABX1YJS5_9BACL|nr:hypothetical protein [Paenibacillus phytohabitans]NOU80619.1 hypothetical protein [Paenibacillus phytohabitans]
MDKKTNYVLWVMLSVSWVVFEAIVLTVLEKWIDLTTGSVGAIATVFLVQNLFTVALLFSGRLAYMMSLRLSFALIGLFLGGFTFLYQHYWVGVYALIVFTTWTSYLLIPRMSNVLEMISSVNSRGQLISLVACLRMFLQLIFLLISTKYLHSFTSLLLVVRCTLYILALAIMGYYFLRKYFEEALKHAAYSVTSVSKQFKHIPYFLLMYFLSYFLLRALKPLNQEYVKSSLDSGFEASLAFNASYLLGGFIISFWAVKIFRCLHLKHFLFACVGVIFLYSFSLYFVYPSFWLYGLMLILGVVNYGITNHISIHIHLNYSGSQLATYSRMFYIIPYISASLSLFVFGGLSMGGLSYMLVALLASSVGLLFMVQRSSVQKNLLTQEALHEYL